MTSTAASSASTPATSRLFGQALLGGATAAVVNLGLYAAAKAGGVAFEGEFLPGTVGPLPVPAVAISSLVPAFGAALLALGLTRFTRAPGRIFAVIAAVFLLLSLAPPLGIAGASLGTKLSLELMHLVAGAAIGGLVYRALQR